MTKTSTPDEMRERGLGAAPARGESEREYLDRQMAEAKGALQKTLGCMKDDLLGAASPVSWVRERPWLTLLATTTAGFAAAFALTPPARKSSRRRSRRVARREECVEPEGGRSASSLLSIIGGTVLGLIRPLAQEVLSAAKAGGSPQFPASTNGAGDPSGNASQTQL